MSKKLLRSSKDYWVGGVFGGLGNYYNFDPNLARIAFIILALCTTVIPLVLIYLVFWWLMPEED